MRDLPQRAGGAHGVARHDSLSPERRAHRGEPPHRAAAPGSGRPRRAPPPRRRSGGRGALRRGSGGRGQDPRGVLGRRRAPHRLRLPSRRESRPRDAHRGLPAHPSPRPRASSSRGQKERRDTLVDLWRVLASSARSSSPAIAMPISPRSPSVARRLRALGAGSDESCRAAPEGHGGRTTRGGGPRQSRSPTPWSTRRRDFSSTPTLRAWPPPSSVCSRTRMSDAPWERRDGAGPPSCSRRSATPPPWRPCTSRLSPAARAAREGRPSRLVSGLVLRRLLGGANVPGDGAGRTRGDAGLPHGEREAGHGAGARGRCPAHRDHDPPHRASAHLGRPRPPGSRGTAIRRRHHPRPPEQGALAGRPRESPFEIAPPARPYAPHRAGHSAARLESLAVLACHRSRGHGQRGDTASMRGGRARRGESRGDAGRRRGRRALPARGRRHSSCRTRSGGGRAHRRARPASAS